MIIKDSIADLKYGSQRRIENYLIRMCNEETWSKLRKYISSSS